MKVKELIELLQTFDGELDIAHGMWSEALLLDPDAIHVKEYPVARPDGWVHTYERDDVPKQKYLIFPGN